MVSFIALKKENPYLSKNAEVVLMRKYVKQAKVHTINKLVKEVKLLQNRKGNESQIQKAKRKAERFLAEIALLKKIKPDNVSKLALSKAKNWKDVLQQKTSTLEDRCIAILANYEAVHKEVEAFHSSNKGLVFKISYLLKQWDEKNKYSENSPKGKVTSSNRKKTPLKRSMKTNANMVKIGKTESDTEKSNNQFDNEEGKPFMNDNCSSSCKKTNDHKNKLFIEPLENTLSDTLDKSILDKDDSITENTECSFDLKNTIKARELINFENLERSAMEIEDSDIDEESEHNDNTIQITTKSIDPNFNLKNTFNKCLNSKKHGENTMDIAESNTDEESKHDLGEKSEHNSDEESEQDSDEESEQDSDEESEQDSDKELEHDSESISGITARTQKIKKNVAKLQQPDIFGFIKKDKQTNNSENKLKTIALLKLDELKGFDEIPVNKTAEKDQLDGSEEESSEDETIQTSKRNDPFFLGCGNEDSVADEQLTTNNNYISKAKHSTLYNSNRGSQREMNACFEQKNSNQYNHKRNFQKFSNNTQFSRRDSDKFQKDKFMPRNHQDRFQHRNKSNFDRNNAQNQRNFNTKEKSSWNFKEKANKVDPKSVRNKFSAKPTEPHKKGNASEKPLHPSWEAKRKQKEIKSASFQGKRMVFDD